MIRTLALIAFGVLLGARWRRRSEVMRPFKLDPAAIDSWPSYRATQVAMSGISPMNKHFQLAAQLSKIAKRRSS